MASETLVVPEDYLQDVIAVILAGLEVKGEDVPPSVVENLKRWCQEEQEYLDELEREE